VIPVGLTIFLGSSIAAAKKHPTPSRREIYMDRRGACHGEDAARQMPIWGGVFVAKVPVDQQVAVDRLKNLISYLESIQR
jgi:hypothetical protein